MDEKVKGYRKVMENIKYPFLFGLTLLVLFNTALIADIASGRNLLVFSQLCINIIGIAMIACISTIVASMATYTLGIVLIRKKRKYRRDNKGSVKMSTIIAGVLFLIAAAIGLYVTGSSFFYILIFFGFLCGVLPLLVMLIKFAAVEICYALDV